MWDATSLEAGSCALGERGGDAVGELGNVDALEEGRVAEIGVDEVRVFDEEVGSGSGDTRVFGGEAGDEDSGFAVVVEFVMNRTLRADGALVEADGGEDGIGEAVFLDEACVEGLAGDEDDHLGGSVVGVHAVETA